MMRLLLKSKIHRARVTEADLDYIGSITIDRELMKLADIWPGEKVLVADLTNGNRSYGGGRFLDLKIPAGEIMIIDFNKAYNPYCAYNHKYSCPIPPEVNHMDIEIPAGVRAYKDH